jgi:hypothetical protein
VVEVEGRSQLDRNPTNHEECNHEHPSENHSGNRSSPNSGQIHHLNRSPQSQPDRQPTLPDFPTDSVAEMLEIDVKTTLAHFSE